MKRKKAYSSNDLTWVGPFKIPTQIHREFTARCALMGLDRKKVLCTLIQEFVKDERRNQVDREAGKGK
jgi:hypothetical protein